MKKKRERGPLQRGRETAKSPAAPPQGPEDSVNPKDGNSARSWVGHLVKCVVLFLIVLTVYSNSFQSGFVLDNQYIIKLDPRNKAASLENIKLILEKDYWWPRAELGGYRPISTASYLLNWSVLGNGDHAEESDQVVGFHWLNLLAHAINATLAYFLMLRLLRRPWIAFFTAAMFAAHPITTESVTNIVGRADEFMAMSFMGGLLLYLHSTETQGIRKLPWIFGLVLLFGFGCFSKESSVAFVAVPALFDAIYRWGSEQYRSSRARRILCDVLWYCVISLPVMGMMLARAFVFRNSPPRRTVFLDNPMVRFDWNDANSLSVNVHHWIVRFMTACNVATMSLWKLIWPLQLSSDYSYNQVKLFGWNLSSAEDIKAILSMLFIAGTLVLAAWCFRRHKAVSFLVLFYWITYGPTSNFLVTATTIMGERFLYLPLVAFSALFVLGLNQLGSRIGMPLELDNPRSKRPWLKFAPHVVMSVILILYGSRSYARNFDWHSDITLGESALKASPLSFRSYNKLAEAYYQADPVQEADHIIELARRGVEIIDPLPNDESGSAAYLMLGIYYGLKGEQAATRSNGLLMMNSRTVDWYQRSAQVLERGAEIDLAANEVNRIRELRSGKKDIPDIGSTELYQYLGMAYARLGLNQKALESFQYMRHLDPRETEAYAQIGATQLSLGQLDEAAVALMQCVILDPKRLDVWRTLTDVYSEINHEPVPAVEIIEGLSQIREDNKLVQQHLLKAYAGFMKVAQYSRNADFMREAREVAIDHYHFDSSALDGEPDQTASRPLPPHPRFHTYGKKLADEPITQAVR